MKYYTPNDLSMYKSIGDRSNGGVSTFYARVERIITSPDEDGYKENGGLKALNGVFFTFLENKSGASDESSQDLNFAFPASINLFHVPIPGEIVQVHAVPTPDISSMTLVRRYYYSTVVNYWGHPKDGLFFDLYKPLIVDTNHRKFKINPVLSKEGDTLVQGRYGQLLRYSKQGETINPTIYLTTGRNSTEPINIPLASNINTDLSSVEFLSKGTSELLTSNKFLKSHRKELAPKTSNTYEGEQILLNTGRFVINTKEESVLISSKKSVSTSSETLNQEASKEICLESPKIFLGSGAMNSETPEPVMLGNKVEEFLSDIIDQLIDIADSMRTATTVSGEQLPIVNQKGAKVGVVLKSLKTKLNPKGSSTLKSKKTFVDQ